MEPPPAWAAIESRSPPTERNEILALILIGSATHPIGVFRGQSALADRDCSCRNGTLLAGRFQIDGVGFLAAQAGKRTTDG
jgi:hypothetical protein